MKKFNILYLAASGDIMGGGQVSLLELLRRLDRDRFCPLVVCPTHGSLTGALRKIDVEAQVIRMRRLKNPFNVFFHSSTLKDLEVFLKDKDINLIHSNLSGGGTFLIGMVAKRTKIPLIWHVRIIDPSWLADRFQNLVSTKIIVISEAVKTRFDWLKEESKVKVVYNGVDLERFNLAVKDDKIRMKFGLRSEPVVGTVSRLEPWKGQRYFLEAAAFVKQEYPDAKFLIVGKDISKKKGYERKLRDLAQRLKIASSCIFTGPRSDIPEIMAALDLFVLPSIKEPFGRVVIEAMACGKPVVATIAGGVPEIVEDGKTGILVLPNDAESLAKGIVTLLKDREKARRMGAAGRRRAEALFSIEANVKKTEHIYSELLE